MVEVVVAVTADEEDRLGPEPVGGERDEVRDRLRIAEEEMRARDLYDHVIEAVGRGGFGTVYRAELLGPGGFRKVVALKVLNPDIAEQQDFAERLRDDWAAGRLRRNPADRAPTLRDAGRPERPALVRPGALARTGLSASSAVQAIM